MRCSSARLAPLVSTRMALPLSAPLKINDLTICPSVQPTRSAASCAVRVLSWNSITVQSKPRARRASWIFWAVGFKGGVVMPGSTHKGSLLVEQGILDALEMISNDIHLGGFTQREITGLGRFVAQAQLAATHFGFEIQRHHLYLVPVGINHQLVGVAIYAGQAQDAHAQAGLLPYFARAGLGHALTRLHAAAGQAPLAVIGAARQQHFLACLIKDYRRAAQAQCAVTPDAFTKENFCHARIIPGNEMNRRAAHPIGCAALLKAVFIIMPE